MKTHYFTFGFAHAHAIAGFTYDKDIVVKITAENPREVMVKYFGLKWAFEYEDCPELYYFPRGVKELKAI